MVEGFNDRNISENDTLDINELALLNNDISDDLIEQLQNKVSQNVLALSNQTDDDSELFEEVQSATQTEEETSQENDSSLNNDIEDVFAKKYKAKQMQQNNPLEKEQQIESAEPEPENTAVTDPEPEKTALPENNNSINTEQTINKAESKEDITTVSGGNINERPLGQEQVKYKESLDYLDENTKYSKYVIYIDPENKEFIDSLTVKERKNLINRIIREQDDIAITKRKLDKTQLIFTHILIALLAFFIAIPIIYWIVNISLETTINNYRNSQSMFQTLYKEHGKIKTTK